MKTDAGPSGVTDDINWETPSWRGLPIILSKHAIIRARDLDMDEWDVAAILEGGVDCDRFGRADGCEERCSKWHGQMIRIVTQQTTSGWFDGKNVWLIVTIKPVKES